MVGEETVVGDVREGTVRESIVRVRDMTWLDAEAYLRQDDRCVLPLGSTEQHAFLSLATDATLAERVATEAAEAALRTYARSAESAAAYQPLVSFHSARGDVEETLRVLGEALDRYPDEAALRIQRCEALLAGGDVEEARAELRRFRKASFDGDPQVEYLEARLALAEGDAEEAVVAPPAE